MPNSLNNITKVTRRRDISSTTRKRELASTIETFGVKSRNPCTQCQTANTECKVDLRSGKCAGCVKYGRKCDHIVTQTEWEKMRLERQKLRQEMELCETMLQELHTRRSCLYQQWVNLEEKASEAISREMRNIDEVDRQEQAQWNEDPMGNLQVFQGESYICDHLTQCRPVEDTQNELNTFSRDWNFENRLLDGYQGI